MRKRERKRRTDFSETGGRGKNLLTSAVNEKARKNRTVRSEKGGGEMRRSVLKGRGRIEGHAPTSYRPTEKKSGKSSPAGAEKGGKGK